MSSKMISFLFCRKNAAVSTIKSVSKLHTTKVSSFATSMVGSDGGEPAPPPTTTKVASSIIKAEIKFTDHETNKNKPWILNGQQQHQQHMAPAASEWESKLLFKFKSCNDAVNFAVGQGWDYTIEQTTSPVSNFELN